MLSLYESFLYESFLRCGHHAGLSAARVVGTPPNFIKRPSVTWANRASLVCVPQRSLVLVTVVAISKTVVLVTLPMTKATWRKKAFVLVILMVGFLWFGLVLFFSLFKGITVHHGMGGGGTMGQLANAGSWLPCCLSHFIPDHGTMLSICSECVFLPPANLSGDTLLDIPRGVF